VGWVQRYITEEGRSEAADLHFLESRFKGGRVGGNGAEERGTCNSSTKKPLCVVCRMGRPLVLRCCSEIHLGGKIDGDSQRIGLTKKSPGREKVDSDGKYLKGESGVRGVTSSDLSATCPNAGERREDFLLKHRGITWSRASAWGK